MPSPLGRALGGMAAGWAVAGVRRPGGRGPGETGSRQESWAPTVAFALLGALPDLDLLVGLHSRYTHSLGAAILIAALSALAFDRIRPFTGGATRLVFAIGCGAAYGSHVLLDWLGSDSTAPIGIMALWPLSSAFYQSELHWFAAISRRYWLPEFVRMNTLAAVRELLLLGPVVLGVGAARGLWTRTPVGSRRH